MEIHLTLIAKEKPLHQYLIFRPEYLGLLKWYTTWNLSDSKKGSPPLDPLLALVGTWTFGDADTYVREMREGWE